MDNINKQQLEILRKVVMGLGKETYEVNEFIRKRCESQFPYGGGKHVRTNDNGELTFLFMGDGSLCYHERFSGAIPPEIGQLTALTHLNLYTVRGSIPPEIGQLKALKILTIDNSMLWGSIPHEIGQLKALTELRLTGNQLSGSIPPEIGQLTALRVLFLDQNQLSGSIPPEMGQMKALEVLRLEHNKLLSGSIPPEMGQLKALKVFDYSYTNISGEIPAAIEANPNIEISKPNVVCDTFAALGDVISYFFQQCESLPDLIRKCGKKKIDDAFQRAADDIASEM